VAKLSPKHRAQTSAVDWTSFRAAECRGEEIVGLKFKSNELMMLMTINNHDEIMDEIN
jgi:hypothetical protein